MKKSIFILFAFFSIASFSQNWQTNFKVAQETATTENKQILIVFQGSDWCAPCMKLEQEIWNTADFKSFAKENLVLVKADFPRRRKNKLSKEQQKHNDALAEQFNPNGFFPLVVVLSKNGKVLKKLGYESVTPKEYIKLLAL